MSCCLHSECLLTGWIKGSGPLAVLGAPGTSQELERGPSRAPEEEHQSYFSGAAWSCMVLYGAQWCLVHGGVWCTLVLGSRTSNLHLLPAQAQAQAAPGRGPEESSNHFQCKATDPPQTTPLHISTHPIGLKHFFGV